MRDKPKRSPEDQRRLDQLGRNIRAERARAGLLQADVAHTSGLAVAQYARTERGEVNVGALTLIRIARTLGVDVGVFFRDLQ